MAFDIGGILSAIGGIFGASSAKKNITKAVGYQVAGANEAANQFADARNRARDQFWPIQSWGYDAGSYLRDALGYNGEQGKANTLYRFQNANPGYEFQRSEALRGIDNAFNAGGARLSGGALMALQDRGDQLANQSFGDWMDRQTHLFDAGRTATAQASAIDAQNSAGMADAWLYRGDAKAAGRVAKNNVNSQLLSSLGSLGGFFGFG